MQLPKIELSSKSLTSCLGWAQELFILNKLYFGHGTADPWDEAGFLASYVLDLDLYVVKLQECQLTTKQFELFVKLAKLRAEHKIPLPYLLHTAWFAGKKYYVDRRVIIPRSPLAELINKKFAPWINRSPKSILDLCTGSGCLAIACYQALATPSFQLKITATDRSSKALQVASKNLQLHKLSKQIELINSDLFAKIPKFPYDLIISNPPYVSQAEFAKLPQEYYFEPKTALVGGTHGLEIVQRILRQATKYLSEKGVLLVEVGGSWKNLVKLYPDLEFRWIKFVHGGEGVFLLTKQQLQAYGF